MASTIWSVRKGKLTFLRIEDLCDLAELALRYERSDSPGVILEAGAAAGGSAIVLASAKRPARRLLVYDVFGLIPPPSDADGADVHDRYRTIVENRSPGLGDQIYYGYDSDLYQHVRERFTSHGYPCDEHGVELIRGLFQDTMQIDQPVALAHIDCDWYESVMTCLSAIEPRLIEGGTLVIDDYDTWSGCRKAVDEYFADKQAAYRFVSRGRLHVVKVGTLRV